MHGRAACGIRYSRAVQNDIRLLAVVMERCGCLKHRSHVWQSCCIELLFKKQLTRLEDTLSHDKLAHWSVLEFTHNNQTLGLDHSVSLFFFFLVCHLDYDGRVLTEPSGISRRHVETNCHISVEKNKGQYKGLLHSVETNRPFWLWESVLRKTCEEKVMLVKCEMSWTHFFPRQVTGTE